MGGFQDIVICVVFLLEVALLSYLEIKAWKTIYTPLNILMLPYVMILLLSISISGNMGFVEFHYPSIVIWCCGLLLFAIPSMVLSCVVQKAGVSLEGRLRDDGGMPEVLVFIAVAAIMLFAFRFYSMLGGAHPLASDEFGEEFAGKGFWGHLRQLALPILIMAIYYVGKGRMWLWLIIVPIIAVAFLYQVKGWVIIPCLSGIMLRLYTGKTRLTLSVMLYVILGALLIFAASYILALIVGEDKELGEDVIFFIFRNIVHYLTSGVLGLSVDMQNGFPDVGGFELLVSQVVNLFNVVTGNDDLIIPLNELYYNTGFNLTNVRSFFGTIYINTGYLSFALLVMFISTCMYLLKIATLKCGNLFMYTIYFFECGLLFMGWFDYYFASLTALELPCIILVFWFIVYILPGRRAGNKSAQTVMSA